MHSNCIRQCRKAVEQSTSPFETALRFAAAANAIDFGAIADVEQPESRLFIQRALSEKLYGDAATTAKTPHGRREVSST